MRPNFRGTQFSRIAISKHFVETIFAGEEFRVYGILKFRVLNFRGLLGFAKTMNIVRLEILGIYGNYLLCCLLMFIVIFLTLCFSLIFSHPVQVWALHALTLIADSGGPLFRSHVDPTLSLVFSLLLATPISQTIMQRCLAKCLSALLTTLGPELQLTSRSMATMRSTCLTCCTIVQVCHNFMYCSFSFFLSLFPSLPPSIPLSSFPPPSLPLPLSLSVCLIKFKVSRLVC